VIVSLKALTKWSCSGDNGFFCDAEYEFLKTIYKEFMLQRVEKGKVKRVYKMHLSALTTAFKTKNFAQKSNVPYIPIKHVSINTNLVLLFYCYLTSFL
jgi:hypothetical protein